MKSEEAAMLRPYQERAVHELRDAIRRHGSAVYVLPTGGGKTVVAGEVARLAHANGRRTLLLVHRRELVGQAVDTLTAYCPGVSVGVEAAGWPSMPWAALQVGMVQSIHRRSHDVAPDLVIVDEAHHARAATWEKVLGRWPGVPRLGLTATPERLDGKGLSSHFGALVLGPTIDELVADGYLAPTRTLRVPSGLALAGLRRDRHGEYRQEDVRERVTGEVIANAADAYMDYAAGKRAIFFGVHTEHSRQVCAELIARGIRAEHVDGTTSPARRDRVMQDFRDGAISVVGNCDLISEGFDAPGCDVVMMGAPTRSVTRYLQQAGRAMRPGPGKTAMVLDLAGTSYELGLADEPRRWSLEDGEIREREDGGRRPSECPACHTLFYGRRCPGCKAVMDVKTLPEVEQVRSTLIEAKRGEPKLRRPELMRALSTMRRADDPEAELVAFAARQGYKLGWAKHILRAWGLTA